MKICDICKEPQTVKVFGHGFDVCEDCEQLARSAKKLFHACVAAKCLLEDTTDWTTENSAVMRRIEDALKGIDWKTYKDAESYIGEMLLE